jgi:HD-like signal output (HDOD) protein
VLADLGATIQVLRMVGREYGASDDGFTRIEDYICTFGPTACFEAVAKGVMARNLQRHTVSQIWAHSRQVAQNAKRLAETARCAISPDQAYTAGLLHTIGSLPTILGWDSIEASHDYASTALKLAERWAFPSYLRDFFCEMLMPGYNPQWSEIIAEARRLASGQTDHCSLYDAAIRPSA